MVTLFTALTPDGLVLLQILQDGKPMAHATLNAEQATDLADKILKLASFIPKTNH